MICHQMLLNNLFGLKFGWCKHTRHVQATFVAHSLCVHCVFNFVVESKTMLGEMKSVECLVSKCEGGSHLGLLVWTGGQYSNCCSRNRTWSMDWIYLTQDKDH